jgi:hypothetical protein
MLDFLGYMIFSGFEYCAIFLFMLSVFTFDLRNYKKEFMIVVFSITFLSYVLVIFNLQNIIPLPLIMIPIMIYVTNKIFKQKLSWTITAVIGGTVIYGAMQFLICMLAINMGYLNTDDLSKAFAVKSYVMQTLSASTAISVAIYIRIFNGGFGFSLRSKKKKYKTFLFAFIVSWTIEYFAFLAFNMSKNASVLVIFGITLIFSSLVVIYLSNRRDYIEYS